MRSHWCLGLQCVYFTHKSVHNYIYTGSAFPFSLILKLLQKNTLHIELRSFINTLLISQQRTKGFKLILTTGGPFGACKDNGNLKWYLLIVRQLHQCFKMESKLICLFGYMLYFVCTIYYCDILVLKYGIINAIKHLDSDLLKHARTFFNLWYSYYF